jgi:hypothetical protein
VASIAHEYPEVLREVLRQVRERCRVQETEALRKRVQVNNGDFQRLGLHTASSPEQEHGVGEALTKDADEGVDGNEHEGTGGKGDGCGGQEMMNKASFGVVEGVGVSRDWLEDRLAKLDQSPGTWGGAGEGQTLGRTHGSIELEEVEVVADHQLPFGHVYDALLSVGCRASAPERKLFLRDHYGPLSGVPEDDISGGHGNIGLKVTVISACDLPQAPTQFLDTVDGYCEIEWEGQTVATHVVENSLAPEWNESKMLPFDSSGITYEELLDDISRPNIGPMLVTLIDWNSLSHHEPIGHFTIQPRALHKVLKFGLQSTVAYTLENDDHVQIQGSQEFYRGQQINLKPSTVTIKLEPLFKEGDSRRKPVAGESKANLSPTHGSAGAGYGVEEVGEEEHHDHVTEEDFEHMVSILPRDEEAMSNVSIHAHSHATVYSLPNSTVLRDMAERFPGIVARMAIFARRQQHARIRLQWQDFGSSAVWLRNREMKRLLLSISKVGMGFAMQKKKMDNVLANMRDARDKAALEARELSAACRPGVGGQVARLMPEISDRDMVVLHRYFDWWIDATHGLAALQEEMETRHALASYAPKLSRLQVQMLEVERLRLRAAMDASDDPVVQRIQEEEEEARILDIRSDDVATGL